MLRALTALLILGVTAAPAPPIAAASDLSAALPEIASLFEKRSGQQVRLTFGSSGNFTQQILNGAPFELFLSADESYIDQLAKAGKTEGVSVLYATGRIGIFVPRRSRVAADSQLDGLSRALRAGTLGKFAIANPAHAPYGRAARDALMRAGLWDDLQSHLVLGENASQATQFATSGSADAGIIPLSLAMSSPVRSAGAFALIPEHWHAPLRQRATLLKGAGDTARAFLAFLQSPEARRVFERYGFFAGSRD
jgi:molybdate transport system substrate-binding protein